MKVGRIDPNDVIERHMNAQPEFGCASITTYMLERHLV